MMNPVNHLCDLTQEELAKNEKHNQQFQLITSEKELVERYLLPRTEGENDRFMTTTKFLIFLAEKTDSKVRLNTVNVGKALRT